MGTCGQTVSGAHGKLSWCYGDQVC